MERLWAPWRMKYILSSKPEGCIFCEKAAEERDEENLILYRGESSFLILNTFPYNCGHLMVVPYRHIRDLEKLSVPESTELVKLTQLSVQTLKAVLKPEGFNIGMNLGRVAGAGVEDHLHIHIIPRWNGDTNFMPLLADTKVLSESLNETYKRIVEGMRNARDAATLPDAGHSR